MNLVKQNRATEMGLPGLGLRIFGWEPKIGSWVGGAIRWVGGVIASKVRPLPWVGKWMADNVESITGYLAQQAEDSLQYIGLNATLYTGNGNASDGLTSTELEKLNKWLPTFVAYAEALTDEVTKAFLLNDNKAMLTGLNAVLNKINAVQDHYAVTNELGLSDEANQQRQYVIYQSFYLIVSAISEGLKEKGLQLSSKEVTFPINQYDYRPLFSSTVVTSVTGDNYVLKTLSIGGGTKTPIDDKGDLISGGGVLNPTKPVTVKPGTGTTVPVQTVKPGTGTTVPVQTVKPGNGSTVPVQTVKPGNGSTVPVQTDNGTTANPTTETKKKYNWLWWLLAGYGGYKVVKAVAKDNKKSKK
ncbi:hypothetical protein V1389_02020 [Flavobacterium rakeshii]|uniref:hypothetical protein n=1 Tax=Flavobacterium rakeshii TaxID=1038845 RepID=UPI002E7AD437|nr:hypothetical protein [Flavobacterium rakeshii]MEE1897093.1 hypothetical protein [Flavobacterium rakeshii]